MCSRFAEQRGYCGACTTQNNKARAQRRGPRVYDRKKWDNTRKRVLFEEPLCRCGCGHISTDVDHIIPIEAGGDPWARENLQGLTRECHSRKTRGEQGQ
jgi:5-methylcytosine-specific restriction endonuclease McrA